MNARKPVKEFSKSQATRQVISTFLFRKRMIKIFGVLEIYF